MSDFIIKIIIPFIQKKWKTKVGFIVICLMLFSGMFYLYLSSGLIVFVWLIPIVLIFWTVYWLYISCRIIINPSEKKVILISFNVEMGAKKQIDRIIPLLKNKLIELSLDNKIKLLIGAEDLISNTREAEKYRKKNDVDLIVWGNTIYGGLNKNIATQFNVHHTFKITPSLQQKLTLFLGDISLILQKRNWTIYEMNDITDHKIVADDLLETCLFIIGLYFFDQQQFDDSIKMFEAILPISQVKSQLREAQEIVYIAQLGRINSLLIDLYFLKSLELHDKGDKVKSLLYLEKIPEKSQNNISILMNLAKLNYLNGNLPKAEEFTLRIKKINKHHPAVAINMAFFRILQKNYDSVLFWYDELLKKNSLAEIKPIDLIEFLEDEYQKNPSEHAFLYSIAIINNFLDKIIMKRNLNRFIRITKNNEDYKGLRNKAQSLI